MLPNLKKRRQEYQKFESKAKRQLETTLIIPNIKERKNRPDPDRSEFAQRHCVSKKQAFSVEIFSVKTQQNW